MSNEPTRPYLQEAVQIASGTSRLLPQREHLMALATEFEAVVALNKTYSEAMSVLMMFARSPRFPISAEAVMKVRAQKSEMHVERCADGSLLISRRVLSPPPSEPITGKVM